MKVVHILRKPHINAYSIEKLFDVIRENLKSKNLTVVTEYEKYESRGLINRILNGFHISKNQGDINHITGASYYLALFLNSQKTIITYHDCEFLYNKNKFSKLILWFFWLYLPVRRASHITAISNFTRKEILNFVNISEEKISVIPDCIPPQYLPTPKAFTKTNPKILLIGTKSNKNLNRVLKALSKVKCDITLIGNLSEATIELIEKYDLRLENKFSISEQEMLQAYIDCDMLVFASTYEGFGMPIIEAQRVGRPVITSNCSSMPEVAGDGAYLVDPFEVNSIYQGISTLIKDDKLRDEIISNGYKNTLRFQPSTIASQYLKLYQQISINNDSNNI